MNEQSESVGPVIERNFLELREQGDLVIVELATPCLAAYPHDTFLGELKQLLCALEDDSSQKLVLFKGFGKRCLEGDLRPDPDYFRRLEKVLSRLSHLPMPSVFILDDECSNFNLQFAINCDFRIGTHDSSFSCPEIKEGFLPGMLTFELSKYVGLGIARKMILGGIPLSAVDAFNHGLLDVVCSKADLEVESMTFATSIIPADPNAFVMGRRLINESFKSSYESALGKLLAVQNKCLKDRD